MRIRTLIDKEWSEVFKNRLVLMTVIAMPLLFTFIPILQLAIGRNIDASNKMNNMPEFIAQICGMQQLSNAECYQSFLSNQFMLLFLLLPLAIPVTIASYSIVGEKTTRSLEPLLATPTTTTEIILGKALASAIPAIAATWLSFIIFLVISRFFVISDRVYAGITNPMWFVAMILVAPLMTIMSVNVAIIISSRVSDPRAAEQIGMMVMLPMLAIFFMQIFGVIQLNTVTMFVLAFVVLVLDAILVIVGIKLFQREAILTQWK